VKKEKIFLVLDFPNDNEDVSSAMIKDEKVVCPVKNKEAMLMSVVRNLGVFHGADWARVGSYGVPSSTRRMK
jgi:hypothetical protein